jgi:hypothetical protein
MIDLHMTEYVEIGYNDQYVFAIGLIGVRWCGFAQSRVGHIFIFAQISDGYELGLLDRDAAMKMTAAWLQWGDGSYGHIDHWYIKPEYTGRREDYLCLHCREPFCEDDECGLDRGDQ